MAHNGRLSRSAGNDSQEEETSALQNRRVSVSESVNSVSNIYHSLRAGLLVAARDSDRHGPALTGCLALWS